MKKVWVADFETYIPKYNDIHDLKENKTTYVWGFAIADLYNEQVILGNTIKEFIKTAYYADTIYFHNLKFDGQFIMDYLLKNEWEYDEDLKDNKKPHTFSILRTERNVMYAINLQFTKKHTTRIRDSLKKLPFSVKKLAKDYNLPIEKGTIDYEKERTEIYEMTEDEKLYIQNDVLIVGSILKDMLDEGHTKMTIGSDSITEWKSTVTKSQLELLPKIGECVDEYLRKAYKGGFTWVNPKYKNVEIQDGIVLDANSMHPTQMYYKDLPCGEPIYYTGEYTYDITHPLYIQQVILTAKLKPNCIPCIQTRKTFSYQDAEYLTECEFLNLTVTNIDLDLIKDMYDIEYIEYIDGYKFRKINNLFKKFIDKWYDIKCNSKGSQRQLAKLIINNLYGKFGTRLKQQGVIPYLDSDVVKFKKSERISNAEPLYLPIAIFTTAYSRDCVIRSALPVLERLCYIDTDSLHLKGSQLPKHLEINSKKLGAWDLEGYFRRAIFLRPKRYLEDTWNEKEQVYKLNVKCGGMPENVKKLVTFENFKEGVEFYGKLMPVSIKGGIVLRPTTYKLK